MQASTARIACHEDERYLGPAEVLSVNTAENRVWLRLPCPGGQTGAWARLAVPPDWDLRTGDQALVIREGGSDLYVIGLLRRGLRVVSAGRKLSLPGGAYAEAGPSAGDQVLRVFSPSGELVVEYDEANRRARVNVECGDLQFVARRGNIEFESGRDVVIQGRSVKVVAGRLETLADTVVEKARNVYRVVERLSQLKAGRLRTLVGATFHLKAGRTVVASDGDCKITGSQIHLG